MRRAMMLSDVIGEKASLIARLRDFQSIAVLLAQAPASVIQMIKNTETGRWLAKAFHTHVSSPCHRRPAASGEEPGLPVSVSNVAGTIGVFVSVHHLPIERQMRLRQFRRSQPHFMRPATNRRDSCS